jgi:hypothetical protein
MSDYRAIAATTATLVQLLQDGFGAAMGGAQVSHYRPDGTGSSGPPAHGINVYLYKVQISAAFRGIDLPTRNPARHLTQRPTLGLELHYLLTFHGDEGDLQPQLCLASALVTLHSRPILDSLQVSSALKKLGQPLKDSDLAEQIEYVRFTPLPLSLDDLSKLWSMFPQTPYQLSVCYQASVVLLDAEEAPAPALPVRELVIEPSPFNLPIIDRVRPETVEFGTGTDNSFAVEGRNLSGTKIRALLGASEAELAEGSSAERALVLPTEDSRAGVHLLCFELPSPFGEGHAGIRSNGYPVQLCPKVAADPVFEAGVDRVVRVEVAPAVAPTQRAVLSLTQFLEDASLAPESFSVELGPREDALTSLKFGVKGLPAGEYLVRVAVDEAASRLTKGQDGRFAGPKVTLP